MVQYVAFDAGHLAFKRLGIVQQRLTGLDLPLRIQRLNDLRGITPDDHVFGHIAGHQCAGADDAVTTHRHALAYGRAVAHPDVLFQRHFGSGADRLRAIIEVVPVGIGDVGPGGDHRVCANLDVSRRVDAHTGTDQRVVADVDSSAAGLVLPDAQPNLAIAGGYHVDLLAEVDPRAVQTNVPGLHQDAMPTHGFELRSDKPIGVAVLEALKQAFD